MPSRRPESPTDSTTGRSRNALTAPALRRASGAASGMQRGSRLAIAAFLVCGCHQQVAPAQPGSAPRDAAANAQLTDTPTADHRALMRQLRNERETRMRERGAMFERIAVQHDYTGEYVLFRDQDVTAFLDLNRVPRIAPETLDS